MSDELKQCPFCGNNDLELYGSGDCWYISCETCDCCGPTETTERKAFDRWNKRDDAKVCEWVKQDDSIFLTDCRMYARDPEGDYCPYCAKKIKEEQQ